METPIEIIYTIFALAFALMFIGIWKKIPFAMVISGVLITFLFIITDSITALGDTNTCVTDIAQDTTTCTMSPYVLDMWIKILGMLLGNIFIMGGTLIWKASED